MGEIITGDIGTDRIDYLLRDSYHIGKVLEGSINHAKGVKKINPKREKEMGERIVEFVNKRKTKNPVVTIVGKDHTRDDSEIYSILKDSGGGYETISYEGSSEEVFSKEV